MFTLKLLQPKEPTDRPPPAYEVHLSKTQERKGASEHSGGEGRRALGESKRETPLNQSSFRNREEEGGARSSEAVGKRSGREGAEL